MSDGLEEKTIRIDTWINISCLFKNRSQATKACNNGMVKVDGEKAKPSKLIKVGNKLTIKMGKHYRKFEIVEIVFKSMPKAKARLLYHEEVMELSEEEKELRQYYSDLKRKYKRKYKGRPEKKERRELERFRGY